MAFLANLPNSGMNLQPQILSNRLKKYICDHDTDPPAGRTISTDPTNIVIRSLTKNKKITNTYNNANNNTSSNNNYNNKSNIGNKRQLSGSNECQPNKRRKNG